MTKSHMHNIGDQISTDVEVVAFISRNNWNSNHTIYVLSDLHKNIFTIKLYGIISVGQKYRLNGTIAKKKVFGKREQLNIKDWHLEFLEN